MNRTIGHSLRTAAGGFIALAVAMGIGRFIYTPILPFMAESLPFNKTQFGLIASANFLGYLLGALAAASSFLPGGRRNWFIAALAASALSTAVVGAPSDLALFLLLRFIGGIASAFVLVFASALVLDRLAAAGHGGLSAVHFAGVGAGIAFSAVMVGWLAATGHDWRVLWLFAGAVSLIGLGAAILLIAREPETAKATFAPTVGRLDNRLLALVLAYGLFGFGYVITATFLPTIVRASPALRPFEPETWLAVGIAAVPSVAFWTWVGRRLGNGRGFAIACIVEAAGVVLSVLASTAAAVILAACLLGGTFMGITALGLIGGSELSTGDPRRTLALMTAAFSVGQVLGPTFAGYAYDLGGSFRAPSLAAAAALAVAAALVELARLRNASRRVRPI